MLHVVSLIEGARRAVEVLDAGELAATTRIDQALSKLRGLADVDNSLLEPLKLIDEARIQLAKQPMNCRAIATDLTSIDNVLENLRVDWKR